MDTRKTADKLDKLMIPVDLTGSETPESSPRTLDQRARGSDSCSVDGIVGQALLAVLRDARFGSFEPSAGGAEG